MTHRDSLSRFPLMFLLVAALCIGPVACRSFYSATVSLTNLVDGASKSYAIVYQQGLVPPDVAAKVAKAHQSYRLAAKVAHDALATFKASGGIDRNAYDAAFAITLQSANDLIALIIPFLYADDAIALQTQIKKANSL